MQRIFTIALVCLFCLGGLLSASGSAESTAVADVPLEKYRARNSGFTISFPHTWSLGTGDSLIVFARDDNRSDGDTFSENISVASYQLEEDVSLKGFSQSLLQDLEGYERIDEGKTEVDGREARYVVWATQIGKTKGVLMAYFFIHRDTGYTISCWCLREEFDKYRPLFDRVAASFRFT
jgi:hypothetical protein